MATTNLRHLAERNLSVTLEGAWALDVRLIGPDGTVHTESLNGGNLRGQVLYESAELDPETGQAVVVGEPTVTLRRTSLPVVPQAGQNWIFQIPQDPTQNAPLVDYALDPTRPPSGGRSLGIIKFPLRRVLQL